MISTTLSVTHNTYTHDLITNLPNDSSYLEIYRGNHIIFHPNLLTNRSYSG